MKYLCIASSWINALTDEFSEHGLDVSQITQGLPGFHQGSFSENDRLDLLSARILWHRAARLSNDPLLGARIGLSPNYRSVGVLAPLIWHSENLFTALHNISKYQSLISENGAFRYENTKESCIRCLYEETPAALPASIQQILSVTVASIMVIKTLSGKKARINKLIVPEGTPVNGLSGLLSLHVVSEGKQVGFELQLNEAELKQAIPGCDDALYRMCLEYANTLLAEKDKGMAMIQQIRRYVSNHGMLRAEVTGCAEALCIHPRALQRQLENAGTSFRKLKDEVLKEHALSAINQATDIKTIAEQLGYTELSGFYRIFKGWFGITPKKALKEGVLNSKK